MDDGVIVCQDLGKCFRMYDKPHYWLFEGLIRRFGDRFTKTQCQFVREFWPLRHISFSVKPGETVGIIGRNGAGKSTLLQLIAGILTPSEGNIVVNGRIAALLELGAGFNLEFTGLENVRISATILGLTGEEIDKRLEDILSFADIGDFIYQPVKTYSSGMYVRLAFAIAIHVDPDILIIDEALAVGDIAFQIKCMVRIRQIQSQGKTLLFVSHDVGSVRALCDRVIYLDQGSIIEMGETSAVVDNYIRDMHQVISDVPFVEEQRESNNFENSSINAKIEQRFLNFAATIQHKPHGTGQAKIRLVEILDSNNLAIDLLEFNHKVKIRIWIECLESCTVSVNYKIRDKNLVAVTGADFLIAEQPLLEMHPKDLFQVDYSTQLPLMEGSYSIRVSLTIPIAKHEQAIFLDIVEVTCPFKILSSPLGRIYTSVYLPNSTRVKKLG